MASRQSRFAESSSAPDGLKVNDGGPIREAEQRCSGEDPGGCGRRIHGRRVSRLSPQAVVKLVADRADDGAASAGGGILCARRRASLGTGLDVTFGILPHAAAGIVRVHRYVMTIW